MRILFVVDQFPTLSESFIVTQIVDLLQANHSVWIASWGHSDQTKIHEEVLRYDLLRRTTFVTLPAKKWKLRLQGLRCLLACLLRSPKATIFLLSDFLKENTFSYHNLKMLSIALSKKCQVIHAHFGPNGLRSLCLKKTIRGIRHLTSFHGYDITVYIRQQGKDVYSDLFQLGDCFTYNSEATKQKLLLLGCPESKMEKLPMGIDTEKILFKERYLENGETFRLLSVGRLIEMKGREYAIRAVAKLAERHAIHYDIVGDGPLRHELQSLIELLNATAYIKLWGWVSSEQLEGFYQDAHLFIHPSVTSSDGNQEGQGVVLLEAQAHGIPVIATRHNAFPDSVVEGKTAFLVEEKNVDQLVERMEYLIQNADLWTEMGRAGRNFVLASFDRKKLCKKLVDYYNGL